MMSGGAMYRVCGVLAGLAVVSIGACTGPAPTAVPLGNENVIYHVDGWRIYFPSSSEYPDGNAAAAVVWRDGQNLAVEVISGNNYWTLRRNSSRETINYRRGNRDIDPAPRPMPLGSPTATHQIEAGTMKANAAAQIRGGPLTAEIFGGTPLAHSRITVGSDAILIVLQRDPYRAGGSPKLWIETDRDTVDFTDEFGATHTFP